MFFAESVQQVLVRIRMFLRISYFISVPAVFSSESIFFGIYFSHNQSKYIFAESVQQVLAGRGRDVVRSDPGATHRVHPLCRLCRAQIGSLVR